MIKPKTVRDYIHQALPETRKRLVELRSILKKVAPKSTESLKWSMPAFSYDSILYTYAGFKKHVGFYPTPAVVRKFRNELKAYKTAKGSIQFPLDKPLPASLIKKMATFRIKELTEEGVGWM